MGAEEETALVEIRSVVESYHGGRRGEGSAEVSGESYHGGRGGISSGDEVSCRVVSRRQKRGGRGLERERRLQACAWVARGAEVVETR